MNDERHRPDSSLAPRLATCRCVAAGRRLALLLIASLALTAACDDSGSSPGDAVDDVERDQDDTDLTNDGDATSDTQDDTLVDTGVDAVDAEFGLDERPSNTTCVATDVKPPTADSIALRRIWDGASFSQSLYMVQAPDDPDHWFVVERAGRVIRIASDPSASTTDVVIDITGQVDSGPGEAGLLGLAFHPDFETNRRVYLSYTRPGPLTSRVAEFTMTDEPAGDRTIDAASESMVIEVEQPYGNHNGGQISFGPDGMLYFGLGDGGSANDPDGNGQNTDTLLGAMLRIDVDGTGGDGNYGIPADNPFADGVGGRPEIYAWGLRNPWRFSFDQASTDFWAGDVGQNAVEEIDLIVNGGNYGWNAVEGDECFAEDPPCEGPPENPYIDPVAVHPQSDGERSITGGYVYRGDRVPGLGGTYVYGDFVSGRIFGLFPDADGELVPQVLAETGMPIASFGQGLDGEMYVIAYDGRIFAIDPAGTPGPNEFPTKLSETGCVDPNDPSQPAEGLVGFAPIARLWSDGADKRRWMALPDGESATVVDGDLEFPVGTVLVKQFLRRGPEAQPVETRLFMHHPDGWAGYSYAWDADGQDATLLEGSERRPLFDGGHWYFPSRGECMQCHTSAAGFALGPEIAQLNHERVYPSTGRRANQLATLEHIGIVESLGNTPAELPALAAPFDVDAPVEDRARAYLHSNCANCHQPGSRVNVDLDFHYTTALADTNACDVVPSQTTLGIGDARIIAPGDPSRSMLVQRMNLRGAEQMPPIATLQVHDDAVGLMEEWVSGVTCE